MDREKVLKLANLARIEMDDAEAESLSHEFESILGYVSEVKSVGVNALKSSKEDLALKNIWREDKDPHESGLYTEKILELAPEREGDYLKVKKIL